MFSLNALVPVLPLASSSLAGHWIALAFVIGTCLGSFVQAAALRLNRDEDVIRAPSRCRGCGRRLGVLDNLPLLGWLKTLGKCRQCGARFSVMYMLVEVIMGGLVAVLVAWYSLPVAMALTLALMLIMICALTDIDKMLLHLPVMVLLGAVGAVLTLMPFWPLSPLAGLMGMVTVVMLITIINGVYLLARGASGFGSGDYWLLGAVGLWLGPVLAVGLFFVAALLGALVGVAMIATNRGDGQTALPFGVFISLVFICWPILNILVIITV